MKPNCYTCIHRRTLPYDAHSQCANPTAKVEGDPHGRRMGWFFWPLNFDPVWLLSCTGYTPKEEKVS